MSNKTAGVLITLFGVAMMTLGLSGCTGYLGGEVSVNEAWGWGVFIGIFLTWEGVSITQSSNKQNP